MKTILSTLALVTLIASPFLAHAASPRAQAPQHETGATGQERTCGFSGYQYDSEGTPTGPYCH
jgi:hypothetical protein